MDTVKYLGHVINKGKISVDPNKTDAIRNWPAPTCVKEVQQFLGLESYYNQFIKQFAQIAAPLTKLLQKNTEYIWSLECISTFQTLKDKLCSDPVLRLPDFQRPFVIETDCSDCAVGAALLQKYDDGYHPVEYYSHKLIPAESNQAPHDCELLVIFKSACKWWCYIDGSQVTAWTNYKPLTNIWTQLHLSQRQIDWLERRSESPLKIIYHAGKEQIASDTLSRRPSEPQFLSQECLTKVSQFFRRYASQFTVLTVSASVVIALSSEKSLAYLACPHYRVAHLATRPLSDDRICGNCGKSWKESRHV